MNQESPSLTLLTGTDNTFTLNFSNSSGALIGYIGKLYLTLKKEITDPDPGVLQIPLNFTTDTNGDATLTITNAQTQLPIGYYWYDFTIIVSGAVTRSYPGKCEVAQSVTQAVS